MQQLRVAALVLRDGSVIVCGRVQYGVWDLVVLLWVVGLLGFVQTSPASTAWRWILYSLPVVTVWAGGTVYNRYRLRRLVSWTRYELQTYPARVAANKLRAVGAEVDYVEG